MQTLWLIVFCGALAIAYAIWATRWVLSQDAGSERMQEIGLRVGIAIVAMIVIFSVSNDLLRHVLASPG